MSNAYCQSSFSSSWVINSNVVKDYQRSIDVSTVLWLRDVPILYVNQSGNVYLVINSPNVVKVFSRFDDS